ncbi:hypothetical protein Tco_0117769 [Tanacetum coccineum]
MLTVSETLNETGVGKRFRKVGYRKYGFINVVSYVVSFEISNNLLYVVSNVVSYEVSYGGFVQEVLYEVINFNNKEVDELLDDMQYEMGEVNSVYTYYNVSPTSDEKIKAEVHVEDKGNCRYLQLWKEFGMLLRISVLIGYIGVLDTICRGQTTTTNAHAHAI